MISEDVSESVSQQQSTSNPEGSDVSVRNMSSSECVTDGQTKRGMVLPFQPLSLTFKHVNYYVDMPAVSIFSQLIYVMTLLFPYH